MDIYFEIFRKKTHFFQKFPKTQKSEKFENFPKKKCRIILKNVSLFWQKLGEWSLKGPFSGKPPDIPSVRRHSETSRGFFLKYLSPEPENWY